MRFIPLKIKKQIKEDPWYLKCCLQPFTDCDHHKKIDIHHSLIFAGHQMDDLWNLVPLCRTCHESINQSHIKEFVEWVVLSRATDPELKLISKAYDYVDRKYKLINIYGDYKEILLERDEWVPKQ